MNVGPQMPGPYTPPKSNNTAIIITVIVAVSLILIVIMGILAAILFPVFARARAQARASACMNNVKQISMAMMQYRSDWNDTYPPAGSWRSAVEPLVRNSEIWNCPADQSGKPSYAMNGKLAEKREADIGNSVDMIMIFESVPGDNQVGGAELLPPEPRHRGDHAFGFVDGHVAMIGQSAISSRNWIPTKPAP